MTPEQAREHFSYDPLTGSVDRIDSSRNRRRPHNGSITGIAGVTPHRGGYAVNLPFGYAGWTKDFFEACCIRKSGEVHLGFTQRNSQ